MYAFDIFTLLLVFGGLFSYLNTRWVHLPPTIGFMLGSLVLSLGLLGFERLGSETASHFISLFSDIDFGATILSGILSFLLFAGSLQLDMWEVRREKWVILTLATVGVILSTLIVGVLTHLLFLLVGLHIPFLYALGFGALISPTDPVIVIGMLKHSSAAKALKMKMMGEALFNDGIAIVLFVIIFTLAVSPLSLSLREIILLLLQQLVGSAALGVAMGWVLSRLISHLDSTHAQIFVTLGAVAGGYDLATLLGSSGPIAVVIMGLFVRNYKGHHQKITRDYAPLYSFWTLLDEFLNAALFVMMGLALLQVPFFSPPFAAAGALTILVVLFGRFVSVWVPVRFFRFFRPFTKHVVTYLTWGGLRGGVSLALALTLPANPANDAILACTYLVVIFSTVVQGLTFRKLLSESR